MREAKAVDFDVLTISPYGTLLAHDKIEYVSGCCVFHVAVALMAWGCLWAPQIHTCCP